MNKRNNKSMHCNGELDSIGLFDEPIGGKECKEPKKWTLITALDEVLEKAKFSKLSEEFWASVESPIDYLTERLEMTRMQVVFLAMMVESGEPMSWRKFGQQLKCSRLSMMVYSDELEELVVKRWAIKRGSSEIGMGGLFEGFALVKGVIKALRHNEIFVPEKIDGLTEQELIDKLESRVEKNIHDHRAEFSDDEEWMVRLCEANPHLPLCHEVLKLDDIHEQSLLLMMVFDYAQWADTDNEGLDMDDINDIYPSDYECGWMRRQLKKGSHVLMERGLIEYKCEDGIANNESYVLTKMAKQELLSAYKPSCSKKRTPHKNDRMLKSFKGIKEKSLFFNDSEQQQIDRLTSLLSQENLPGIQKRLEEQGMRKGVACLFYGGPGTGKTETVLQIARKTGRDIINKRTENISHSVDKMDNAMQNIILQEIEDLEGILIATTNLTQNLDSAFERRFLFKVEFNKPNTAVKAKIWSSMMKGISDENALVLAQKFDFSGGQIENIVRKRTIDFILSGEYADMEEIEGYCRTELLENKKACKPVMGFRKAV